MKLTKKKTAAPTPDKDKKPLLGKGNNKGKGPKLPKAKKKQSFDMKAFMNSVNSLNGQNYGSAPLPVKIFLIVALIAAILLAAWFGLINGKREEIAQAESQQVSLLEEYKQKESKARHLDEYKAQVAQMEIDFAELLNQLPKGKRTAELIEDITMVGSGSGIRFQEIVADSEIEQEFFIEQPIKITGIGDYHQFGDFMSGISTLPRIITMHDFEVKNQQPSLDVMPELQLVLETKTYRSKEAAAESTAASTTTPEQGAAQ